MLGLLEGVLPTHTMLLDMTRLIKQFGIPSLQRQKARSELPSSYGRKRRRIDLAELDCLFGLLDLIFGAEHLPCMWKRLDYDFMSDTSFLNGAGYQSTHTC